MFPPLINAMPTMMKTMPNTTANHSGDIPTPTLIPTIERSSPTPTMIRTMPSTLRIISVMLMFFVLSNK